ncbi:MAG: hypothetical protein JW708_07180 [Vallitaleaceae bacterium]|nr:hypothetical protein [Vallitaleaceae bacterium]
MKTIENVGKRIVGTFMLPLAMYFGMMLLSYANGKMYYGTWMMWKTLLVDISLSVTCALGIGLQLKSGRFDFSGGAIMLVAAILAGNIAKSNNSNPLLFFGISMIVCVVLSLLVGLIYVYGRLPIVIATIGMALFLEAVSCLIYGGKGINLVANMKLKVFSTYPMALVPMLLALLLYVYYSSFTISGKRSLLLANNQQAAVNIGIRENKNVLLSYLFSGMMFGFATTIYASTGLHGAAFTSLVTVGQLFSNILPVFIGFMLIKYCGDAIGIIMGSITLSLMSYGLNAVFSAEMGTAISIICTGIFVLVLNVISAQGNQWIYWIKIVLGGKKNVIK